MVSKNLRKRMLQTLHSSHQGTESTLRRARETIYWSNMKSDIKDFTSKCKTCASYSTRQQETLISHDVPDRPWAKISTDLFDLDHKSYMVTVDYFSGFFEIDRLYDLKVSTAIRKLKADMARYGIPDEVVSDSGSQYTSQEFKTFAKEYGFNHVTTVPIPISLMVKLSLLSRKQRRPSKKLQRPKVTLTWCCWLIVTPHRMDLVPALPSVCSAGEQNQTFLLLASCGNLA